MEGSHARLEKHLPPYLSSIYLPTYLSALWLLQLVGYTLPSSYYSSFYTLLQNAILQIEHKHIVTITFLFHMFFTLSYDVNLASHLEVQCTPDLVTSYLVTNPDLVTILQKTVFLLHKNILFSDNLVFSDPSI